MKKLFYLALLGALAAILGACAPAPEPLELTITMTEYAFEPNEIEARVGQKVTLTLINEGTLVHELMIGRNVMMMGGIPSGYQMDMFETAGVEPMVEYMEAVGEEMDMEEEGHAGFMVKVPVEGPTAMTFTVTEAMLGEWEMGCFELDGVHYTSGMKGTFTVTR